MNGEEEKKESLLLKAEHITKLYKTKNEEKRRGIEDISFEIRKGQTYGIIGQSGAGKSTLAKVIAGIEKKTAGSFTFYGKEIQLIFQNPFSAVNPRMCLEQIIEEPWIIRRKGNKKERARKVEEMLQKVRLEPKLKKRYPWEVSGGQLQRAIIARSLMLEPDLIVADEITASLDVTIQAEIMEVLLELKKEYDVSCMLISHDLYFISKMCDRVMVLDQGRCIEEGEVKEIWDHPKDDRTKQLLKAMKE